MNLDFTHDAYLPRLRRGRGRGRGRGAVLELYADLKRHDMVRELPERCL